MSLFSRSSRRQVGVDIGTSSIKAVETEQDGSRLRLSNYGIIEGLDFFGSVSASPKTSSTFKISESEVAVIIRKLFDLSQFSSQDVVFSIPIFSTFLTTISLPQMEMKELERAVQFQARSHIPVPLSEVVLDWIALPESIHSSAGNTEDKKHTKKDEGEEAKKTLEQDAAAAEKKAGDSSASSGGIDDPLNILEDVEDDNEVQDGSEGKKFTASAPRPDGARPSAKGPSVSVLLVAVPREIISKYETIAAQAGLRLKAVEVENFSLVRSLLGNDLQTTVVVDFGMRSTALTLVDQGFVHMSHSVDFSGRDITRAIERGLNVSFDRAEEIKKQSGLLGGNASQDVKRLVSPLLHTVVTQIEKMAGRYLSKERQKIDRIILTGGTAKLPGLKEYIAEHTSAQTIVGNPFARLAYPPELEGTLQNELSTTLATAVGLSMRE